MSFPLESIEPLLLDGLGPVIEPLAAPLVLTIARFSGLVCTAPLLSSPAVTWRFRLALAVLLGVCFGIGGDVSAMVVRGWGIDIIWLSLTEVALGASLGFGAKLLLAGLELTAGLIEQQAGWSPTATSHPNEPGDSTATGGLLAVLAGMTWLLLSPLGGDLRIVSALLDSLRVLPVGSLASLDAPVQLLRTTLSAACLIGFQVAAPVVVSVGLLQGMWSLLARARGGALWQPALSPIRMLLALLVLTAAVTDVGDALALRFNQFYDAVASQTLAASNAGTEPVR